MNIKSLLLGSAATMVAVSGAQAADAVVVEAEPVEYVRVCDAYGSGYFFIPGTETCIRFSGFIRTSYEKATVDVDDAVSGASLLDDADAGNFATRVRFNIDARNETDWGTLRSLFRIEAGSDNQTNGAALRADIAMITLGGFRAGQNGANYWSSNHGFAGVNLEGVGSNGDGQSDDGWYGFNDSQVFDYTWSQDGLSITAGIEDIRNGIGGNDLDGTLGGNRQINYYAGFNYSADFGTIAFTAAHDSNAREVLAAGATPFTDGGWAYKASISLDLSEFLPGGTLYGSYQYDGDYQTDYLSAIGALANPESIVQVGFQANLTDEVELVLSYNYAESAFAVDTNGAIADEGDADLFAVGLNWYPAATPGFHIKTSYYTGSSDRSAGNFSTAANPLVDTDFDAFTVTLRRDF